MDIDRLLTVARETVDAVTYCFAVTAANDGYANARIVQPRRLQADWTVDFTTSRRCRKYRELTAAGKVTLGYQHDPEKAYVCLRGPVAIIDDIELKRARWSPDASRWFPKGPDDPNVTIFRLSTDRIELWNSMRDVMPEPKGFSAAVLVRDGDGWRYEAT
jgi:general stress protein 26